MHNSTRRGTYRPLKKKHKILSAKIDVDPSELKIKPTIFLSNFLKIVAGGSCGARDLRLQVHAKNYEPEKYRSMGI